MSENSRVYKNVAATVVAAGVLAGAMYSMFSKDDQPVIATKGFPKGYHIEKVCIPTRGNIIRVEKLPGETYKTEKKNGYITFKGKFGYEIEPLRNAMPKDPYHTDMKGHTPENSKYWEDEREGAVIVHKNESLEAKINK